MTSTERKSRFGDYLSVMRPDHWLKNLFIFFGSGAALVLLDIPFNAKTIAISLYCLAPACLIASANYILNEILDAPFDRIHPTKSKRSVASGLVQERILWGLMAALIVGAVIISLPVFNYSYIAALALLLGSGLVYNVSPIRLKDRAFLDVIAESFNNPIRLWLGWYAIAPAKSFPPLSVIMAWWMFGALLMTGKRYAEFRFIGDAERSGHYRKSFKTYTELSLLLAMVTYANLFCFCAGTAVAVYRPNLVFAFPLVMASVIAYFNAAISVKGAKLEPEELLKNPTMIACTLLALAFTVFLLTTPLDLPSYVGFFKLVTGK